MNGVPVSDVRSFAMFGHTGSGKTTLVDALLFKLGLNDRLGSVDAGSSLSDFTDEEKSRKISIFAKPFSFEYQAGKKKINMVCIDSPGYIDFAGQASAAASVTETGLITIDASSGVQVGTRRAWKRCDRNGLARAIIITGLDRDNTDFAKTLDEITTSFGSNCVPVVLPKSDLSGVVDVLDTKDIPDDLQAQFEEIKGSLVELAAETDDTMIEKFLGGETLAPEEIGHGLRDAVRTGGLVPVFVCMALKDIGTTELLNGISRMFPSPVDVERKDSEGNVVAAGKDEPFAGFVWRTVNDPFVGQLNFVRVLSGTIKSDSEVQNTAHDKKERIGSLLLINGKKQESVAEATAGDIVAIPKLKVTSINNTLCEIGKNIQFPAIEFPGPVMFQAVTAKTQADEDKLGVALSRICEEDPTLHVDHNKETKETVLQGLGDVHIDVAVGLMKSRSNVEVTLETPKVPYRETVTTQGKGHYKHKKQSGGRGQYGEVYLKVEPKQPEDEEWFVDEVVGGAIPGNFMPAVQKGLVEGLSAGAVAGCPIKNIKIRVYDGSYHDVDSSEVAFKIAGSRALKDAVLQSKPVLLEPIMTVKISVPDRYLGDINGDLNHKRGRIMGMGLEDGVQVITAEVPHAELFRYVAELRSMTGGQGMFEMEFCRYDVVPSTVAQKVIAELKKEDEEH